MKQRIEETYPSGLWDEVPCYDLRPSYRGARLAESSSTAGGSAIEYSVHNEAASSSTDAHLTTPV